MPLPPHDRLLLRYGEVGLKSRTVRIRMEKALQRHLEDGLLRERCEARVRRGQGRLYIDTQDLKTASDVVAHTFGITTFSPCIRADSDLETVLATTGEYAKTYWPAGATTFAVRARRSGQHPYSSQDVAVKAGSAAWTAAKAMGIDVSVDLDEPDFELFIEVRERDAYLYHERIPGPGGLPLGTQGRLVVVLDSADAAAAAYMMMRRGAALHPMYFPQVVGTRHRPDAPAETKADDHPAVAIHAALRKWNAPPFLKAWWLDDATAAAVTGDPPPDDGVALQRTILDAAGQHAHRVGAQGIVTGETSRSLWARRLPETAGATDVPVLRPVMGLTRPVIDDFREVLGLPRLAGPRRVEAERTYTAGGRRESRGRGREEAPMEGTAWDPW